MGKWVFLKFLALLTCFVGGSLVLGLAFSGADIKAGVEGELYAQEAGVDGGLPAGFGHANKPLVISLTGDVLLASGVGEAIEAHGPDYPWRDTAGLLRESGLAVVNLECAVSERGEPEPDKEYTFRASPRALAGAVNAGIDVITLANNHTLDFGQAAMADTINLIRQSGMTCTGAGQSEAEAFVPAVVEKNGKRVAVLAFSRVIPRAGWIAGPENPGLASGHDFQLMLDSVGAARKSADIVVVSVHWGNEREEYPDERDVFLARALVDAGADVVAGHHPHVLQGIEMYKGKVIAYSLGNFIFTTSLAQAGREGAILQVTAGEGEYSARIIPTLITDGTTRVLKGSERESVLERVSRLSGAFHAQVDDRGEIRKMP